MKRRNQESKKEHAKNLKVRVERGDYDNCPVCKEAAQKYIKHIEDEESSKEG